MKAIFLAVFFFVFNSNNAVASEIVHTILPGDLHSGGSLIIKILEERQSDFDAQITYKITPRLFVPVPRNQRQGTLTATLPIEYLDERGYETLAENGPKLNQGATIEHLGIESLGYYRNSHHVKLTPKSRKWFLEAWYNPSIAATGWVQLAIELQNIPLVGKYKVYSKLSN